MTAKTKSVTEEPKEVPEVEIRKIKSRRAIKLIMSRCPLCNLKYTEFSEVKNDENKQYFQLIQFGTNPDGTGYESYFCQFCERFFMMIISEDPIMASYEFKNPKQQQQKKKGGMADLFAEIFGGGGNGQGQAGPFG